MDSKGGNLPELLRRQFCQRCFAGTTIPMEVVMAGHHLDSLEAETFCNVQQPCDVGRSPLLHGAMQETLDCRFTWLCHWNDKMSFGSALATSGQRLVHVGRHACTFMRAYMPCTCRLRDHFFTSPWAGNPL